MYAYESTQSAIAYERRLLLDRAHGLGRPEGPFSSYSDAVYSCGAPHQLRDRRLAAFEDAETFKAAAEYVPQLRKFVEGDDPLQGVVMLGEPTTGKTSLAVAMMRKALSLGKTARFISFDQYGKFLTTWIELSSNSRAYDDYAERADGWRRELWRMQRVYELLVIDDVGRGTAPDFVLNDLHELVRERTGNEGCRTVLTSNLTVADFRSRIGEAFAAFLQREFNRFAFTRDDILDMEVVRGGE